MSGNPRLVVLTGSTSRPSTSRSLGQSIAEAVKARRNVDIESYDIIDAGRGLAAFRREELSPEALSVIEAVEQADALIAVTPVYKGSYPGLFKHLIDFVEPLALSGKPVIIGATGGGHRHALIVEHQLRPLFGFFSAHTIPTSVYAATSEFAEGVIADPGVIGRIGQAAEQMALALRGWQERAPS